MNIRMLTIEERERFAYAENHPDKELLGDLFDTQEELQSSEMNLGEAEEELEEANAKLDEIRELL